MWANSNLLSNQETSSSNRFFVLSPIADQIDNQIDICVIFTCNDFENSFVCR